MKIISLSKNNVRTCVYVSINLYLKYIEMIKDADAADLDVLQSAIRVVGFQYGKMQDSLSVYCGITFAVQAITESMCKIGCLPDTPERLNLRNCHDENQAMLIIIKKFSLRRLNMKSIEKVEQFLKDTPVVYLTTVDGDRPKCRPIGLHLLIEDTLYFGIGTFKEVYQQMQANPNVELCVCKEREFLRYYGKAIFESDSQIANAAIAASPILQKIYNETTGKELGIFHLENATAEFRSMAGIQESFSFE